MKTKHALQSSIIAAALVYAGASYAAPAADTYNYSPTNGGGLVIDMGAQLLKPEPGFPFPAVGVAVYEMTNTNNFAQQFLAYCIAPTVDVQQNATYTAHYGAAVSNGIKALFESSYASTINNADKQVAFQLALWDLKSDDGKMFATTGSQYFTLGNDSRVDDAQTMLDTASHWTVTGKYSYTTFTGATAGGAESQELLGVSTVAAVPEADTWAMLAAGLGLVGLAGARQSRKNEKFAA